MEVASAVAAWQGQRMLHTRRPRTLLSLLSLLTALAVAATGASAAHASFPGRNGVLAVSYGFHCVAGQIATLELDGRPLRMLTPRHCAYGRRADRASWSADGRHLIFGYEPWPLTVSDHYRFAVMNADGSERRDVALAPAPLVPDPVLTGSLSLAFERWDPAFAADGEHVIYTRSRRDAPPYPTEVWSAGLDGGEELRLGTVHLLARMSPDARRIAYVGPNRPSGEGCCGFEPGPTWVMSAVTGKPLRRLSHLTAMSIDWSPDSKRIVFTSLRRVDPYLGDVYAVRANGTGLRRLTSTTSISETDAVWSPEGRRIAFVREVTRGTRIAQAIWTMRPDGTAQRQIRKPWVRDDGDGRGPVRISWQPLPRR